jgi:H+/Cl- antiporter ClcA
MIFLLILFVFLTCAITYSIGLRIKKFTPYQPTLSDIRKAIAESEFSSNDEM